MSNITEFLNEPDLLRYYGGRSVLVEVYDLAIANACAEELAGELFTLGETIGSISTFSTQVVIVWDEVLTRLADEAGGGYADRIAAIRAWDAREGATTDEPDEPSDAWIEVDRDIGMLFDWLRDVYVPYDLVDEVAQSVVHENLRDYLGDDLEDYIEGCPLKGVGPSEFQLIFEDGYVDFSPFSGEITVDLNDCGRPTCYTATALESARELLKDGTLDLDTSHYGLAARTALDAGDTVGFERALNRSYAEAKAQRVADKCATINDIVEWSRSARHFRGKRWYKLKLETSELKNQASTVAHILGLERTWLRGDVLYGWKS
jgi:hypothetical protein